MCLLKCGLLPEFMSSKFTVLISNHPWSPLELGFIHNHARECGCRHPCVLELCHVSSGTHALSILADMVLGLCLIGLYRENAHRYRVLAYVSNIANRGSSLEAASWTFVNSKNTFWTVLSFGGSPFSLCHPEDLLKQQCWLQPGGSRTWLSSLDLGCH